MKKIFILFASVWLILILPLVCYAEWVDADRSGQESILVYDVGTKPNTVLDSQGKPHIAWIGSDCVYYLYWNSSAWVDADGIGQESVIVYDVSGVSGTILNSEMKLDSLGRPHIAFAGDLTGGGVNKIGYLYWDGSAWVDADGSGQESVVVYDNSSRVSLDLNLLGQPGVSFVDIANGLNYLYWNGSAWVDADGTGQESMNVYNSMQSTMLPQLRFNSHNQPCLAFVFLGGKMADVYYLYWNDSAWVDADGAGQEQINISGSGKGRFPSLRIGSDNNPRIAFCDFSLGPDDIYFLKWNGSAWVDADGAGQESKAVFTMGSNSEFPSLYLDTNNEPAIAWDKDEDDSLGNFELYFLKWNGSAWVDADGSGQEGIQVDSATGGLGSAANPRITINRNNNYPCVVWEDNNGSAQVVYYLQWDSSSWVDADGTGVESSVIREEGMDNSGHYPDIALDRINNYPHVVWYNYVEPSFRPWYLEWWQEPSPSPTPVNVLPESGKNLIGIVNRALRIE